MRRYSDKSKKPERREFKKLKKKEFVVQTDLVLEESVINSKYKEWNVADIGLSKDAFTMMYHSFQNLDKAKPRKKSKS